MKKIKNIYKIYSVMNSENFIVAKLKSYLNKGYRVLNIQKLQFEK